MFILVTLVTLVGVIAGCGAAATATPAPAATAAPAATNAPAATEAPVATQAAAASSEAPLTKASKPWKIAGVNSINGIPYWNRSGEGFMQAAKDFGFEGTWTGPTEFDSAQQVKMLEDLVAANYDAIVVCPIDPAAPIPVLKRARERGIVTVGMAGGFEDPSALDWNVLLVDDHAFGEHLADMLVRYMGDSGEYAVLVGGLASPVHTAWYQGVKDRVAEKYPNLKEATDRIPTNENQDTAREKTLELIKAYPNLKGIIAIASPNGPGAAQAIKEKGMENKITLIGNTMPSTAKPGIKDGSMKAALLYDPFLTTYVNVYVALLQLEKKPVVTGLKVPNTENVITVNGKVVIPGPYMEITPENIDTFSW